MGYRMLPGVVAAMGLVVGLSGCARRTSPATGEGAAMSLTLTSTAFADGQPIPAKYTADGEDLSPPLAWTRDCPPETEALALLMDDPDAPSGVFTHWLVYDLPPMQTGLDEGIRPDGQMPKSGGRQGRNDFGKVGYRGPAPPPGKVHHYHFRLYCLDARTGLPPGASRREFLQAIEGHVLAEVELVGTFER